MNIRPSSVPLITVDPYFSVWSPADRLTDCSTVHWTGRRNGMVGMVKIDGKTYRFMGKLEANGRWLYKEPEALPQTGLDITPTSSEYTFENDAVKLTVTFRSPLLLDDPVLFSRPVSYIEYDAKLKGEHEFELYFDVSAELSADWDTYEVKFGRTENSLWCGNVDQKPLNRSGDNLRIDWGYLHLARKDAFLSNVDIRKAYAAGNKLSVLDENATSHIYNCPTLAVITSDTKGVITLAYDDVKSIEYFGEKLDPYYRQKYASFDEMLKDALSDYDEVKAKAERFDNELTERLLAVGKDYAAVGCLLYRQAIAAHKLVQSPDGPLFLSKECFSNGCIATLDVTYPSIPLFLLYNPELVKGMLRPIIRFARSDKWEYDFAPHDCGRYPLCNGQIYGLRQGKLLESLQMPIEECANFIICVAAVCIAEGSMSFYESCRELCDKWADYLSKYGYDPGNQLCTDDFAGHIDHNCNLSVKAIVALGIYARLSGNSSYFDTAKAMADKWTAEAATDKASRRCFDKPDSWSLKYNMVWDRIFGLGLFADDVYKKEVDLYSEKMERYGVALDSEHTYTKLDWEAWTTVLCDNKEYRDAVYAAIRRMVEETDDRVPVTDWYFADTAVQRGFQNRTVVGGYFINLMI